MDGSRDVNGSERGSGPLAWAVCLACSWTWCIGMFLPALLARDYGAASFLVFLIPNMIGAGAMAWTLATPHAARVLMENHRSAISLFSLVTASFHAFFLGWVSTWALTSGLQSSHPIAGRLVMLGAAIGVVCGLAGRAAWLAIVPLVITIGAMVYVATSPAAPAWPHLLSENAIERLAWLAPVMVLGFLMCPYLDVTFLRARASTSAAGGKIAFGVGFGLIFPACVILTLIAARALWPERYPSPVNSAIAMAILAHLTTQAGYTTSLHLSESRLLSSGDVRLKGATVLALCSAILLGFSSTKLTEVAGLSFGEVVYRGFMGFYGLVFPAYVTICMLPSRGGAPTRSDVHRALLVIVAASPFYWLGFVERREVWLAPGVAIVLMGALLARRIARARRLPTA